MTISAQVFRARQGRRMAPPEGRVNAAQREQASRRAKQERAQQKERRDAQRLR